MTLNSISFFIPLLQTGFKPGHRRTPSELDFVEKTRLDSKAAMNKELNKLVNTVTGGKAVRPFYQTTVKPGLSGHSKRS